MGKKHSVDTDLVKNLAELLENSGLSELEVETDDLRVRVVRNAAPAAMQAVAVSAPPVTAAPAIRQAPVPTRVEEPASTAGAVNSPMVGSAYLAPEPGAKPFIEVGSKVMEGQTCLIIEAMKTMNPIPAPRAGTVTSILVDDGDPVEFGQPLFVLE